MKHHIEHAISLEADSRLKEHVLVKESCQGRYGSGFLENRVPLELEHEPACNLVVLRLIGSNPHTSLDVMKIPGDAGMHALDFRQDEIASTLRVGFDSEKS